MLAFSDNQIQNRPTLVLLHGFCETKEVFNPMIEYLGNEFRIISFDLSGFGQSSVVPTITLAEMAKRIKDSLSQIIAQPFFIMGHSMGAYVSLAFYDQFPFDVLGIGMLHSSIYADSEERKLQRQEVIQFIKTHGKEKYLMSFIPGLFSNKIRSSNEIEYAIELGKSSTEEGIIAGIHAMMQREDFQDKIINWDIPFFWAIGKNDALIPEKLMFEMIAKTKKSKMCYLEESGHNGMLEEPQKLAESINHFINFYAN